VPPLPPDDALADWLREGLDALTVAWPIRASVLDLRRPGTAAWWRQLLQRRQKPLGPTPRAVHTAPALVHDQILLAESTTHQDVV